MPEFGNAVPFSSSSNNGVVCPVHCGDNTPTRTAIRLAPVSPPHIPAPAVSRDQILASAQPASPLSVLVCGRAWPTLHKRTTKNCVSCSDMVSFTMSAADRVRCCTQPLIDKSDRVPGVQSRFEIGGATSSTVHPYHRTLDIFRSLRQRLHRP